MTFWKMALAAGTCALASAGLPAAAQQLRVVTEDSEYSYLQDGTVVGSATEVVEQTLRRAGITDYRIDLYPWARAQDLALREPYVLIYLIARTPEREPRMRWVGEILRSRYYFFGLPGRSEIRVDKADDARAWTIGVVRDDVRQRYLREHGFQQLVVSAQQSDNLRKLLYRQVDLLVLTETEARRLCDAGRPQCGGLRRLAPMDEAGVGLYMALSLATPEDVANRARAAFESLRADGSLQRLMGAVPGTEPPQQPQQQQQRLGLSPAPPRSARP